MMKRIIPVASLAFWLVAGIGVPAAPPAPGAGDAGEPPATSPDTSASRALLDSIRADLAAARFEKALSAVEAFLAQPGIGEAERAEALILRSQIHASFGDLKAAERDYRQILTLRPGYEPDPSLTAPKVLKVFRRVRAAAVGTVVLRLSPPDAEVRVDGRRYQPAPDGKMPVPVGDHRLRAEKEGFDPVEVAISVAPGAEVTQELQLLPNARTVVVRTEPAGVEVRVDGTPVGVTRRPATDETPGVAQPPAELTIRNLSLGDHSFELTKKCYHPLRFDDMIHADLMDLSPMVYDTMNLQEVHTEVRLENQPTQGELLVDGSPAGRLPVKSLDLCSGRTVLEVRSGGRTVWYQQVDVPEQGPLSVNVAPRPNAVLVGADRWPAALEEFAAALSTRAFRDLPAAADLTDPSGWEAQKLPPDTDLAVAVLPVEGEGARPRFFLYSPLLHRVKRLDEVSPGAWRPRWDRTTGGFLAADSRLDGPAVIVRVVEGGPAEVAGLKPGDRVVSVAGRPVASAATVVQAIRKVPSGETVTISVMGPSGQTREVKLPTATTPVLGAAGDRPAVSAVRAAWAALDAAAFPDRAPAALANLAMEFFAAGLPGRAAETWRRVHWEKRTRGVGAGTVAYGLARAFQAQGREDDARAAYRLAAASRNTAFTDEGPPVAPAAADHLADLGETSAGH